MTNQDQRTWLNPCRKGEFVTIRFNDGTWDVGVMADDGTTDWWKHGQSLGTETMEALRNHLRDDGLTEVTLVKGPSAEGPAEWKAVDA